MFNWKFSIVLFIGYFALIHSRSNGNDFIHLALGSLGNHNCNNDTNNNNTNNNGTNNGTSNNTFMSNQQFGFFDEVKYDFFPFPANEFTFYVRGYGILNIILAMYPTPTVEPTYNILLSPYNTTVIKDGYIVNITSDRTGLSEYEFTEFRVRLNESRLILTNGTSSSRLVDEDVKLPLDMEYIGFAAETGSLQIMFGTDQLFSEKHHNNRTEW